MNQLGKFVGAGVLFVVLMVGTVYLVGSIDDNKSGETQTESIVNGDIKKDVKKGSSVLHRFSTWKARIDKHLDKKDVTALYSDVIAGARRIYRVAGEGPSILVSPGDVFFNLDWQPGLRLRFYKNIHVFLGPTIGRASVGFHIGLGF